MGRVRVKEALALRGREKNSIVLPGIVAAGGWVRMI